MLEKLKEKYTIYAMTNGLREDAEFFLRGNGVLHLFDKVVSADGIKSYKPDIAVQIFFF